MHSGHPASDINIYEYFSHDIHICTFLSTDDSLLLLITCQKQNIPLLSYMPLSLPYMAHGKKDFLLQNLPAPDTLDD